MNVLSRIKSTLLPEIDYDGLDKLDKPCPSCGNDTLHVDAGRIINIYRCSSCRHEGAGPQW